MPHLLLLPGMMCDQRLFAPQIAAFSDVVTIEVPALSDFATVRELATDVLDRAPASFMLAGLSMGGIVAMEIVRQASERVSKLALLDTNPLAETVDRQRAREPQIERVRAGGLIDVMRDELKPNYLADGPVKPGVMKVCMEMACTLGAAVFERQSRALQTRSDQCDTLCNIRIPTLVLCGEHDRLCPPERHAMMHAMVPGSVLEIVAGAGHLPTLEQPEKTNAALARWMEE